MSDFPRDATPQRGLGPFKAEFEATIKSILSVVYPDIRKAAESDLRNLVARAVCDVVSAQSETRLAIIEECAQAALDYEWVNDANVQSPDDHQAAIAEAIRALKSAAPQADRSGPRLAEETAPAVAAPCVQSAEERMIAPPNSLPTWDECHLRVENSDFLAKRKAEGGYGPEESDAPQATELHRFIYEYDDADDFKSGWFLHRLERLLNEVSSARSSVAVAAPTDDQLSRLFANYRHYVADRAPSKDLAELHERQRKAWEGVFGTAPAARFSLTPTGNPLTEEQIEAWRKFLLNEVGVQFGYSSPVGANVLCDMAKSALSATARPTVNQPTKAPCVIAA